MFPGFVRRWKGEGCRPVFVHLGTPERAKPYFDYYHLSDVERVSDPEASLYGSSVFQLPRKNVFSQILVPAVWKGWLQGALRKHGIGLIKEDADQMPGIFYLRIGALRGLFGIRRLRMSPDYLKLIG